VQLKEEKNERECNKRGGGVMKPYFNAGAFLRPGFQAKYEYGIVLDDEQGELGSMKMKRGKSVVLED
jgi:hypothetical protein